MVSESRDRKPKVISISTQGDRMPAQGDRMPDGEVRNGEGSGLTDLVRRKRLSARKGLPRTSFQGSPDPLCVVATRFESNDQVSCHRRCRMHSTDIGEVR
jgi:hypothetical protein